MGAGVSVASSTLDSSIKSSIKNVMTSTVDNDVDVVCNNIQLVDGARNCNIEFGEQTCRAIALSSLTSNAELGADIAQDIMQQISSSVASSTEGLTLQLLQISHSCNVVRRMAEVTMDTEQAFTTKCTRSISATNEQAVKNCHDSTVKLAKQDISAEAIGDCVSSQVGNLKASQKLTNLIDMQTSATTKGVDLWVILLMLFGGFIALLFIPVLIYAFRYAINSSTMTSADRMKLMAAQYLLIMMILAMILWWPGIASIPLGISPWPQLGVRSLNGEPSPCQMGKPVDPDVIINTFMWYDPYCLSKQATTYAGIGDGTGRSYCSEEDQRVHYKNCGLFANNGCDDPKFLQDENAYSAATRACGKLGGATFPSCMTSDITTVVFATEEETVYDGCYRCTGRTAEEQASDNPEYNFGYWAANGQSCVVGGVVVYSRSAAVKSGGKKKKR